MSSLTHGLYYYPAAMQPAVAKLLLETVFKSSTTSENGGTLLDPFCGGGTVLIEGIRQGRTTIGTDISPLALFISTNRTWIPQPGQIELLQDIITDITFQSCKYKLKVNSTDGGKPNSKAWLQLRKEIENYLVEDSFDFKNETNKKEITRALWFVFNLAYSEAAGERHYRNVCYITLQQKQKIYFKFKILSIPKKTVFFSIFCFFFLDLIFKFS